MGSMLLLGNPSRRRRRRSYRRNPESTAERSAAAKRGWRMHRSSYRGDESRAERSAAARKGWRHRRGYRRNPESHAERVRAAELGWKRRRRGYRRNPIETGDSVTDLLKVGGLAGAGALGVDVVMGMLKGSLPTSLQTAVDTTTSKTNWGYFAVKAGLAIGLAKFGGKMMRQETADALAVGSLAVTTYSLYRGLIPAGSLPLGYFNPGHIVGSESQVLPPEHTLQGVRLTSNGMQGVRLRAA